MGEVALRSAEAAPRLSEPSLASQSVAMSVGLLASRGLAFLRDILIAFRFGASSATDAYLVAAQLPVVAENLLAGPALQNALIPAATINANDTAARERLVRLLWNMTTLALTVNGVAALLLAVTARWYLPLFAGGFTPEIGEVAVQVVMIVMLSMPFIALTRVAWAVLNASGRFWGPALSLSLGNLALIVFALGLAPQFGIYALGAGFVVGAALQVGAQFWELRRLGLLRRSQVNWRDPDVLQALRVFGPLAVGQLVLALSPIIDNAIATFLPPGGVTVIRYAQGVVVPFSLVSIAVAAPALPRLSRGVAQADLTGVAALLLRVVRPLCLVLFGAAAWTFVSRDWVVSLLYQRGAFDAEAVRLTANTLGSYAFYIPFAGLYYFLIRGLVAFGATRAILAMNLLALVLNVVLDLLFLPLWAHAGIALSSLCVQVVYTLVGVWLLNRRLPNQQLLRKFWRPVFANGTAAIVAIVLTTLALRMLASAQRVEPLTELVLGQVLVAGGYLGLSAALGALDIKWLRGLIPGRFRSLA